MGRAPPRRGRCRRARRRRRRRRRAAARNGGARRRERGRAAREALERHRVGRGRGLVDQAARERGRVGGRLRLGPGRRVHHHEAVVAAPVRARRVGASRACLPPARLADLPALERVRDRPRRRVGHGILQRPRASIPRGSARDRRRRHRLAGAASVGARSARPRRHHERVRAHRVGRAGDGRQHGGRARCRARCR